MQPSIEVFIAEYTGDADYRAYVEALSIRRQLLQVTGFYPL